MGEGGRAGRRRHLRVERFELLDDAVGDSERDGVDEVVLPERDRRRGIFLEL